ncbi:MAG TPA: monofunctional biosynthetic peptidoglycan transglycosylase [Chitinophagaceae bacterium]|nr:monofunctional biosynthetic peptidoglycan transglycosylase [Chitinophagaceae bacterium]
MLVLKKIYRFFIYLFISSIIYVIIIKLVQPPITITQLTNAFGLGLKRDYVSWNEMSYNIKLAALASEDQSFTDHSGFDWDAIEKSLRPKKKKKKSKIPIGGGASTITQQTAKNVFLWQGGRYDKYIRKIPEVYFTFLIEWIWGKKRILEVYLNVIETGPGCFGVEAAAQHYFHKSAKNLSRAEAAMIVAGFPNPKKFTARPMTRRVSWRYPQILREMNNIEGDEDIRALLKN